MQLPLFPILPDTVKIIDAKGIVARLLNFDQQVAGADTMNPTRRNEETIAGCRRLRMEQVQEVSLV